MCSQTLGSYCAHVVRTVFQVEVAQASSELILRGLQPGTKYEVRVRVNLDRITYSGYWSDWSDPVFMETQPAGKQHLLQRTLPFFQ